MSGNKHKILLIEDEEFLGDLLVKKIKNKGYEVEWSKDGKEGLEKAKNEEYHLLLLDMMLPDVNGYNILEELNAIQYKTPIIIISNSGQPVDVKKAKELGAEDYLVKSNFSPEDVMQKIHEHLETPEEEESEKKQK